jgi:curli biogenesis system outer membrane secretion channel CsgG
MKYIKYICLVPIIILTSCGTYFNQPLGIQKPTLGESSETTVSLKNLPKPAEPIVVGVYKFRDQTGQYKASEAGSTFSTAITQGATTILIKALEDSKWFTPIERENLGNLLNERNIIRSTRQEYAKGVETPENQLTPLLYAGVLLEGGIISYDSNILTGGFGARYFGAGGSAKYRQDRISIYLRLVSTSNGKILKTVYVSKTILSQSVDASLFRYVNFKRLLEVETGYTKNEPVHMAVTEAIEKAVESLVIEGIKDNVWQVNAPASKIVELINNYDDEKLIADQTQMFGRHLNDRRGKFGLEVNAGTTMLNNDYPNTMIRPLIRGALKYSISPTFTLNGRGSFFWFANKDKIDVGYSGADLNLEANLLPYDKLSPYFYLGAGYNSNSNFTNKYINYLFGGGIEYLATNTVGFRIFSEYHLTNSDNLDYKIAGKQNDKYLILGAGLSFYFGKKKDKQQLGKVPETTFNEYLTPKQ